MPNIGSKGTRSSIYHVSRHAQIRVPSVRGGSTRFSLPAQFKAYNGNDEIKQEETNVTKISKIEDLVIPAQPTRSQLLRFYLPCLALWLSGPLLSLVDTAFVGLTAAPGRGAAELGALGPATTFIDGSTYLFAFLNVATTNLYANALAKNRKQVTNSDDQKLMDDRTAGDGVIRTATKISLICGFFLLALLLSSSRFLLKIYIGDETALASVLEPASAYVNIRAWSMPTTLLANVLQAALLGAQDSVTPLIAVLYSTIVNIIGDWYCVVPLRMGSRGAAIATVAAQYVGTLAMIRPARQKLFSPKVKNTAAIEQKTEVITLRSFLAFAAPVLTLILGKIAAFGIMTHVAAALPGVSSLAAHQITLTLFFFMSPFMEVISQTAQAFLPQFLAFSEGESVVKTRGEQEADRLAINLLKYGLLLASLVGFMISSVPRFFPFLLSNDISIQNAMRPLSSPLTLGALLTAPVAVSEGILLAKRDLKFLASVYLLSTAVFPFALCTIKKSQGSVVQVWYGFAVFQLFRAILFSGRVWGSKYIRFTRLKKVE